MVRRSAIWPGLVAGVGAFALVYLLLAPISGVDTLPPECYAFPGYVVPCDSGLWAGVAIVAALAVGAAVYGAMRRRRS